MYYGSKTDNVNWMGVIIRNRINPAEFACFPSTYEKVYLEMNDALYGIHSNVYCIPHLAQWGIENTPQGKVLSNWLIKKQLAPYLQNMNDDELASIEPLLTYVQHIGSVHAIRCYDHAVELSVKVDSVRRTLLITVMNMMDYENGYDHLLRRETLN